MKMIKAMIDTGLVAMLGLYGIGSATNGETVAAMVAMFALTLMAMLEHSMRQTDAMHAQMVAWRDAAVALAKERSRGGRVNSLRL